MTQSFRHGDYIEGYGVIVGLWHTATHTVYICHNNDEGFKYYKRPL